MNTLTATPSATCLSDPLGDKPSAANEPYVIRRNCVACNRTGVTICGDVGGNDVINLHNWMVGIALQAGETLYRAEGAATDVFLVRSGIVKLIRHGSTGGQRIVRVIKRNGVAGIEGLFAPSFEHTAIAVGEVTACRISTANFRRLYETNPALQKGLLEYSQFTLREAESWLSELAGGNAQARERMARLLLRMRDHDSNRVHRFNLEDIGAMLGITIETASRILSDFSRSGYLTKQTTGAARRYYKADLAALKRIADGMDGERAISIDTCAARRR